MFKVLKVFIALVLFVVLLYLGHTFILEKAGRYLYHKDELKPADVIVILAGEKTERVEYGVKLFKEGWARKDRVLLAGGPVVWKYTWASLMKEQAKHLGVPDNAILLEERSMTTEENAKFTKDILNRYGYKSCILVTSPYHSQRAFIIFKKILGKEIKVICAPSEESWFNFDKWWERKRDRATVLREYSKLLWFWIYGGRE